MLTMETVPRVLPSKKDILNAAMESHESVMNDFRERILEMEANEADENANEHDKYPASHRAETIAEMNLLREQLEFASREWDELLRIESYYDEVHDRVEFGSVVETDKRIFFVSASIEEFKVGDCRLFGLSVHTPLYKAMRGKRKGDIFRYAGESYTILSIF